MESTKNKSKLELGDVTEILQRYDDESFSGCFCDPPYGLSFMGKEWDGVVPDVKVWSEVFRVLKPGSHLLAFGGTRTWHRLAVAVEDAGFEIRDTIMWVYGSGFPKSLNLGKGYGTGLKPAYEPCILAIKPLDGNYANNAEKHGIAGINIDVSRVGLSENDDPRLGGKGTWKSDKIAKNVYMGGYEGRDVGSSELGRYPANLIHDGSEEVVKGFPKTKTTYVTSHHKNNRSTKSAVGDLGHPGAQGYDDDGSAARFFYVPKPSQRERNEGVVPTRNTHPTVKPIKLCEYLARMILPPTAGHKLLVPFSGSGSEIIGSINAGWSEVTGIEISKEFVEIAKQRIEYHCGPKGLEKFMI